MPKLRKPMPGIRSLLHGLGMTKTRRSLYDHYMLHLHNLMKADIAYQQQVPQIYPAFPPMSTWIVYTDQVSHAAMSGQHVLEQTFYLPPEALLQQESSPLGILEKFFRKRLI